MATTVDDDNWPSLAPIRTNSSTPAARPPLNICRSCCTPQQLAAADSQHGEACCCTAPSFPSDSIPSAATSSVTAITCACNGAAPCSIPPQRPISYSIDVSDSIDLGRQSPYSKKACIDLWSCFSFAKPRSSPSPQRRCTPTCMRKHGPLLRSMASLFHSAGSIQSFYSSPRGKAAQLSGAFPRSLSASKLYIAASPRTPAAALSSKMQQFSSPRTLGSGSNLHALSVPRTPASSSKVQNFSGSIQSPRTPFASPSSARRRRLSLFMPPGTTVDKKKAAANQPDEPTSPQVTCIGRVRRQSHCRKPHLKDTITPQHSRKHNQFSTKKGAYSRKSAQSETSGLRKCHSIASNDQVSTSSTVSRFPNLEACKQKYGRNPLQNLYRINGDLNAGDECDNTNNPDQQGALVCHEDQGAVNGNLKDLMHLSHARHLFLDSVECIDGNLERSKMQDAGEDTLKKTGAQTATDSSYAESTEYENVPLAMDTRSTLRTTLDLHQEAYRPLQPRKSLFSELQHEADKPSIDRCLLLIRSTSSRKISDFNLSSPSS